MMAVEALLLRATVVARSAREHGNHPFGALLVSADDEVLLEAENTVVTQSDATGHAETNLVRLASAAYSRTELADTTVYTSTEPWAMCAGAIYWAGIGRVVYALAESELLTMTGDDPENPTLDLSCRQVFAAGQRAVEVFGPYELGDRGRRPADCARTTGDHRGAVVPHARIQGLRKGFSEVPHRG